MSKTIRVSRSYIAFAHPEPKYEDDESPDGNGPLIRDLAAAGDSRLVKFHLTDASALNVGHELLRVAEIHDNRYTDEDGHHQHRLTARRIVRAMGYKTEAMSWAGDSTP